jgi:membrane associated rhomboid family serine protease
MRDAAVGFQCPECVKEGSRTVREKRTLFGGRASASEGMVTKVIIGLCVLGYVLQQSDADVTLRYAMSGYGGGVIDGVPRLIGVATGEYYRMITSAFLHGDVIHIAFNMYALYAFGPTLERALGTGRFIAVYLLSALGGSVLSYLITPTALSVGASGAVFGLFGAYFVVARRVRADTSQIVGLVAINLLLGAIIPRINNAAHVGGLVVGAALTWALAHTARMTRRDAVQAGAMALVLVVLVALTLWKTADVRDQHPELKLQVQSLELRPTPPPDLERIPSGVSVPILMVGSRVASR